MIYLILILGAILLFTGFLLLTAFERKRGLRIAGVFRNRLDAKVGRVTFIAAHVDWGAFAKHVTIAATQRAAHDIAHTVLVAVRTVERMLTRFVRYLRERRGQLPESKEDASGLERAAGHVRHALRAARSAKLAKKRESEE